MKTTKISKKYDPGEVLNQLLADDNRQEWEEVEFKKTTDVKIIMSKDDFYASLWDLESSKFNQYGRPLLPKNNIFDYSMTKAANKIKGFENLLPILYYKNLVVMDPFIPRKR